MTKLKTVFAGSPQFAANVLDALITSEFCPSAVYTQPDRAQGRGRKVTANPVKQLAVLHDLPVMQPENFKDADDVQALAEFKPDILIVVAYGLILPKRVLNTPNLACLNVHASLLPRWRGAAPIERAYMAGDAETGVCIMEMEAGLDTGPVYRSATTPITDTTTIDALEDDICNLGIAQLLATIADFNSMAPDLPPRTPQEEEGATYAHKLTAADRDIDWSHSAHMLARQINALANRMPVRVVLGELSEEGEASNKRVQLIHATAMAANTYTKPANPQPGSIVQADKSGIYVDTAEGVLRIDLLKFEGKAKAVDAAAALNGHAKALTVGNSLGPC